MRRRARRSARLGCAAAVVAVALAGSPPARAAVPPYQRGDVFSADGQWFDTQPGPGVREFSPAGALVRTIPGTAGAHVICFDPNGEHLIAPGVGLFTATGGVQASSWASVTGAQRCVADGSGRVYVSSGTSGAFSITQYATTGTPLHTFDLSDVHGDAPLALDVAPDGCTVYFGDWGAGIGRINGCTDTRGTNPFAPSGYNDLIDDLRVLADGHVVFLRDPGAYLLDDLGQAVRTFAPAAPGELEFRTMSLDPDGHSLWICCDLQHDQPPGQVFRFDIATGQELAQWALSPGMIAVYGPPLLGDADIESGVDSNPAGVAEAFATTAGSTGRLSALHLYVDASSSATQAVVGVYADKKGHPGALQAQATIGGLQAGSWNTIDVPSLPVTAGQRYWIAVLGPRGGGSLRFRDTASGGTSETSSQRSLTTLPGAWSTGHKWSSTSLSAYGS
jgi:hypothetical protein